MMVVANAAKSLMSGGEKVSEANQEDHMGAIGKQPPVVERAKARLSEAREQAQSIPERIAAVPGQIRESVQNVGVKNIKPNLQQVKQQIQETPEQIRENVQELGQHLRLRDEDQ
jgi:peptidoglycan hydrolase CwlO-like protein